MPGIKSMGKRRRKPERRVRPTLNGPAQLSPTRMISPDFSTPNNNIPATEGWTVTTGPESERERSYSDNSTAPSNLWEEALAAAGAPPRPPLEGHGAILSTLEASLADATSQSYNHHLKAFHRYLVAHGLNTKYPQSIYNIMSFLVTLMEKGYLSGTIRGYLSAISFAHKVRGYQDPNDSFLLKKFMIGIKRKSLSGRPLQPVTLPMLEELLELVDTSEASQFIKVLLKALFALLYHGCMRISELGRAGKADHALHGRQAKFQFAFPTGKPKSVTLHFRTFKHSTKTAKIKLLATKNPRTCPVNLLFNFQSIRPVTSYLICGEDGQPVARQFVVTWLNRLVARSSFSHMKINTHSFRIGRTTDLALAGSSDAYIRQAGRWSSSAYLKYIRPLVVL